MLDAWLADGSKVHTGLAPAYVGHALVTGGAGFIGSHLADRLIRDRWKVTVADNLDGSYDTCTKRSNIGPHLGSASYTFVHSDVADAAGLAALSQHYDVVIHLAAKTGVRESINSPMAYWHANGLGTQSLLEWCRRSGTRQFVFASSSSVYGINPRLPWCEDDHDLRPISPYASTKICGESLGRAYAALYGLRFIALRLFTVYGPRQRPDLAIYKFARAMYAGDPVPVYGMGDTFRDYTYVDDVVDAICAAVHYAASEFEVVNVGHNSPTTILDLIREMERTSGLRARLVWHAAQPGDVPRTRADISKAKSLLAYEPRIGLSEGLKRFFEWFRARRDISVSALGGGPG
jgi:UDP-glucuronate 4-epimerase